MSHLNHFNAEVTIDPDPVEGTQIGICHPHIPLLNLGYNMLVEVSTPSAVIKNIKLPATRKTLPVMAHFDTGASVTVIDQEISKHLDLVSTGEGSMMTANGKVETANYVIDIAFLNTNIKSIQNLQVGSCSLNFDQKQGLNPKNFGLLIGRDIMSLWNIVWHGPTSTVFISD